MSYSTRKPYKTQWFPKHRDVCLIENRVRHLQLRRTVNRQPCLRTGGSPNRSDDTRARPPARDTPSAIDEISKILKCKIIPNNSEISCKMIQSSGPLGDRTHDTQSIPNWCPSDRTIPYNLRKPNKTHCFPKKRNCCLIQI